jgi:hypothetical protein
MVASKKLPVIEIDLNTRMVGADEPIYVLFPGEAYTLYNIIRNRSVLVLDFPGLDLGDARRAADLPDLRQRVAMATRIRNWHKAGADAKTAPSRNLNDYRRFSITEARAIYIGAVEAVFFDLKPGAIVVVPGPGHWGDVLIGEVMGGRTSVTDPVNYPGETIPARRVRWIARRPKSDFSEDLIRRLPTPNPFTLLTKDLREEVFTLSFENVVYGKQIVSQFSTTKAEGAFAT